VVSDATISGSFGQPRLDRFAVTAGGRLSSGCTDCYRVRSLKSRFVQEKLVSAVTEERLSMRNRAITVIPVASSGARIGRTNKPINA